MGTGSGLGMRRACSDALQIGLHALQIGHVLRPAMLCADAAPAPLSWSGGWLGARPPTTSPHKKICVYAKLVVLIYLKG